MNQNVDQATVDGFGEEWGHFDQSGRSEADLKATFDKYFSLIDFDELPDNARVADAGCGSGRWAKILLSEAPKVEVLHLIDASPKALAVARRNVTDPRARFVEASVGDLPMDQGSLDFAYSLGVIHHTPDPGAAVADLYDKIRPGGRVLVYLYYDLENRPRWMRALWSASNIARTRISQLPHRGRRLVTDAVAALAYWPLARTAKLAERAGLDPERVPLAGYRDKPFYVMRTDALDRLGTAVEHRYSRDGVAALLEGAGFMSVEISDDPPYWCATALKPQG